MKLPYPNPCIGCTLKGLSTAKKCNCADLIQYEAQLATLKAVYEWGNEHCLHKISAFKGFYFKKHECHDCWQELTEEVKVDG